MLPFKSTSTVLPHKRRALLCNAGVRTIGEIRRLRLEALRLELNTTFAEMSAKLGRSRRDATLSQISKGQPNSGTGRARQMGDDQARLIEATFTKPPGWMDRDPLVDELLARLALQPQAPTTMPTLQAMEAPPSTDGRPAWPFRQLGEAHVCGLPPNVLTLLEGVLLGFLAGVGATATPPAAASPGAGTGKGRRAA